MKKRTRKRRPKRMSRREPRFSARPTADAAEGTEEGELQSTEVRRGVVETLYSGACRVECEGRLHECVLPSRLARDQRFALAVGDEVSFAPHGGDFRVLEVSPRRTVLSRPDPHRPSLERVVAANIDVVVHVASVVKPPLRPALIDRYLVAIERGGAKPLVCVNKIDLLSGEELARELEPLDIYRQMGLPILTCSAATGAGIEELRAAIASRTAVFVGHSGVGKSSLANALSPGLEITTSEVSHRYARGRHTTTRSHLYRLGHGIRLIDTPGIRELGLWRMTAAQLRLYFSDFEAAAAACRFNDCSHTHEPECAVRQAVGEGGIVAARYATYVRILESLESDM